MNTQEIIHALKNVKQFQGVRPADDLPRISRLSTSRFYILNTDPSDKPGEHWVAVYIGETPEFFDSLGHSPSHYYNEFEYLLVNRGPKYMYNAKRIQNYGSDVCGHYCIFYVVLRSMGYSLKDIVRVFNNDLYSNDRVVRLFYDQLLRRVN